MLSEDPSCRPDSSSEESKQAWNTHEVLPLKYITQLIGKSTWEGFPKKTSIADNWYYTETAVWRTQRVLYGWCSPETDKLRSSKTKDRIVLYLYLLLTPRGEAAFDNVRKCVLLKAMLEMGLPEAARCSVNFFFSKQTKN